MSRFKHYNYDQDAMVLINYQEQLQTGTFFPSRISQLFASRRIACQQLQEKALILNHQCLEVVQTGLISERVWQGIAGLLKGFGQGSSIPSDLHHGAMVILTSCVTMGAGLQCLAVITHQLSNLVALVSNHCDVRLSFNVGRHASRRSR
jgi:hypothetical protein